MNRPNIIVILVVIFLALSLPYIAAAAMGGQEHVFAGFLANPSDAITYLAKMYQGWSGEWIFRLPYSAEPGSGAYLNMFYLFLGHLARWLGIPLIMMFHLARLAGAGLLLFALTRFYRFVFATRPELYRAALWLTVIGSGMGWLILAAGDPPTDFWVAEAYPFLSMYTNPHFPTGLALILFAFLLLMDRTARYREGKLLLVGLLIAVIMPFGLVVAGMVALAHQAWIWQETRRVEWRPLVSLGLLGGPVVLYYLWVVQVDPVLAIWNQQNQTPSPPVWDLLLAFSPALILAPFGIVQLYKDCANPARKILIAWFVLSIVLIYIPFSLQRRFMVGFYIPVAALAMFGIDYLRQKYGRRARMLMPVVFALALPTNLLLILIALFGAAGHAPVLYLHRDEVQALNWIQAETPARALILAAPEMGAFIPGYTGRRVIYGHPFETPHAELEEQRVSDFYGQKARITPETPLIRDRGVNYVLYGPRERQLSGELDLTGLRLVYESGDVQVYAVQGAP